MRNFVWKTGNFFGLINWKNVQTCFWKRLEKWRNIYITCFMHFFEMNSNRDICTNIIIFKLQFFPSSWQIFVKYINLLWKHFFYFLKNRCVTKYDIESQCENWQVFCYLDFLWNHFWTISKTDAITLLRF